MGRVMTIFTYFLGAAILVWGAAYLFTDKPAEVASGVQAVQPVDGTGKDETIDMSHLVGGLEGVQKRRMERAILEARYQQDRVAMMGESEEVIAQLDRQYRLDLKDMRERHEKEVEAEAVAAAEAGSEN